MARITVEDCIRIESNRFNLVIYASRRARNISAGATLTVSRDNDKNPVVALREIADCTVPIDTLKENIIKGMQRHFIRDEAEQELEDEMDVISWQGEMGSVSDPTELALNEPPKPDDELDEDDLDDEDDEDLEEGEDSSEEDKVV